MSLAKNDELLRPITTGENNAMNQSKFRAFTTINLLQAREKSPAQGEVGFGLTPHWLKKWREIF